MGNNPDSIFLPSLKYISDSVFDASWKKVVNFIPVARSEEMYKACNCL
jgi:hypothetical protein